MKISVSATLTSQLGVNPAAPRPAPYTLSLHAPGAGPRSGVPSWVLRGPLMSDGTSQGLWQGWSRSTWAAEGRALGYLLPLLRRDDERVSPHPHPPSDLPPHPPTGRSSSWGASQRWEVCGDSGPPAGRPRGGAGPELRGEWVKSSTGNTSQVCRVASASQNLGSFHLKS